MTNSHKTVKHNESYISIFAQSGTGATKEAKMGTGPYS